MSNFKIGDVVKLKSGGPAMTVVHIVGESGGMIDTAAKASRIAPGTVQCQWFSDTKESVKEFFSPDVISHKVPLHERVREDS